MAVIPDPNVYDIGVREGVGPLENGDLVVLVLDDAYVYDPEDATVADLVGNEVSGGAYARETITATVDRIGDVWLALPDSTPSFDLTGITRGGFVVARDGATDADRKLVRWFPDPAGPEVSAEPSWPDGILQARIDTGEAAGGGVQSVTGTAVDDTDPANPVIDLSGVQTIVAGTGITVDDTDPASPIISATGGGGGAVMLPPPLDLSADGSSYVEADLTGLAVDEASRAIIVSETTDMVEVYLPEVVDDFPPEPDGDGRVIAARGPVHIFANGSISHEFDLVIGGLTVRSVQGRASATLWPCWSGLNLYEWKADTDATGDGGGGAYNTTPEVNTVGDEEDGALLIDASGIDPSVRSVAYLIADTVTSISVQMPDHETRGRLALAFYAANPVTVTVSLGAGPAESFDATNLMTIDADYVEIDGWAMWLPFGTWSL